MALPYRWQWRIERWKNSLGGLFGGENEPPRPKICPACGALVGISATRCHECGTSLTFSLAAMSRGLSKFFGGRAPVTTLIFIVNVLLFGLSYLASIHARAAGGLSMLWGMSGEVLDRLGASWPPAIRDGQWFRLVTAMFLHGGLIHLGFNMMVLLDFGPMLEELYGSARYLFLYVTTGIAGFTASAFIGQHPSVGASTALMGLIGAMIAVTTKRGGAYMRELRSRLTTWVVSIFVIGWLLPVVDNWGHFGGLAAGFVLGKLFADREPLNPTEVRRAQALGWLAGAAVLASFAFMVTHILRTS